MLSQNAERIVQNRYLMGNEKGWKEVCKRVSTYVSAAEVIYDYKIEKIKKFNQELYDDLVSCDFIFNSPTLFNAGNGVDPELLYKPIDELTLENYEDIYSQRNPRNSLSACFVIPVQNSINEIFSSVKDASLITKAGGGVGFNFSHLSHKGRPLDSRAGKASGPISFMEVFDSAAHAVIQGGRRRAAQLGTLRYDHPDILEFIDAKADKESFKFFNLSVLVDDYFMKAAELKTKIALKDPVTGEGVQEIEAEEIFNAIAQRAWENGDPGLLFYDTLNRDGYVKGQVIESTNPCQPKNAILLDRDRLCRIDKGGSFWKSWATGYKELLELTCNNGLVLKFTPEHKIMLEDESFVEAKDSLHKVLKWGLGDRTVTAVIEEEVLRGFLFGDGFLTGSKLGIGVKINEKKEAEVEELLLRNGFKQQESGGFYHNRLEFLSDVSFLENRVYYRILPEDILYGNSNKAASFLRGLFEANGSCNKEAGQISLKSTCREMLSQVQILLASFGIPSWIVTNKPSLIHWHNGDYISRESYNLQIAPRVAAKFQERIGFISKRKINNIRVCKKEYEGALEVIAIKSLGVQEVWDYQMYEPPHYNFCQGVIAANCGEIGTYDYGSCNLGHINLSNLTDQVYATFDTERYVQLIHRGVRYLDDIIEMNWYPLSEITKFASSYRPIGLGIMGFAHSLFKRKIKYGSEDSIGVAYGYAEKLMRESNAASVELAKKRGAYPEFDIDVWGAKSTSKKLDKVVLEQAKLYGVRNAAVNTAAPTGTCSLIADTSSGIEPVFALEHTRIYIDKHGKEKEMKITDPIYNESLLYLSGHVSPYFVDASQVPINEHVEMQAVWQQFIDQSISKTINIPFTATVEDVKNAYTLAFNTGCKGVTIFRDGCRDEQVLYKEKKAGISPKPRPKTTYGRTSEIKIGCGTLYITLNLDDDGKAIEAFLTTGKGGGCRASSEGLGRMISVNLRSGIAVEEVIKQLENIKCPSCVNRGDIRVKSCPDAVAKELKSIIADKNLTNGNLCAIVIEDTGIKCEECGSIMMMQEGCNTCPECGFSRCN